MIDQLEANLILRDLRDNGRHQDYGYRLLQTIHNVSGRSRLHAKPFHFCLCTVCKRVLPAFCAVPVTQGCVECQRVSTVDIVNEAIMQDGSQQYWIVHSNLLGFFSNCTTEEHEHFETALYLMWRLQENVSL